MVTQWEEKGCDVCRKLWESGKRPPELAINYDLHSRLHKCSVCETYWEQLERYADIMYESDARKSFPGAFQKEGK